MRFFTEEIFNRLKRDPRVDERIIDLLSQAPDGRATARTPAAFAMDFSPDQIVRMIQIGTEDMREALVSSNAPYTFRPDPANRALMALCDALLGATLSDKRKAPHELAAFHENRIAILATNGRIDAAPPKSDKRPRPATPSPLRSDSAAREVAAIMEKLSDADGEYV